MYILVGSIQTTSDQSTAAPVIASSSDQTSASAHSATGAQIHVAQPAVPASFQGEFPQKNDISGARPHLNQARAIPPTILWTLTGRDKEDDDVVVYSVVTCKRVLIQLPSGLQLAQLQLVLRLQETLFLR